MKATTAILALLLVAVAARAQEEPQTEAETRPDYSRESLLRLVVDVEKPEPQKRVSFPIGAIEFRALGTRFQFVYLPMMPLSGSITRTTQEWPDPFSLTGTAIAMGPRAWRTERARNSELRRIDRTERARLRVERD